MPTVPIAFVRALADAVGLSVSAEGRVTRGPETLVSLAPDAEGRVSDAGFFALLARIEAERQDRLCVVSAYARAIGIDDLGALGLAIKTAPTLRASLQRVERYFRLLTDTAVYRLDEDGAAPRLVLNGGAADLVWLQLRAECALAAFARHMGASAAGPLGLRQVTFRHACRGAKAGYAAAFGCPVVFGAEADALVFEPAALERRNRLSDGALSSFLTAHLDGALAATRPEPSLRAQVLRRLEADLSTGIPQAAALARDLGLSERTFFRRLAEEGYGYRDLVTEAQHQLARRLLRGSGCSIAEIAFLTGFAEQSAFSRAFKRWEGEAPAQYRARPRAGLAVPVKAMAGAVESAAPPAR
jgi:AraC-like DNA-binding protein